MPHFLSKMHEQVLAVRHGKAVRIDVVLLFQKAAEICRADKAVVGYRNGIFIQIGIQFPDQLLQVIVQGI